MLEVNGFSDSGLHVLMLKTVPWAIHHIILLISLQTINDKMMEGQTCEVQANLANIIQSLEIMHGNRFF